MQRVLASDPPLTPPARKDAQGEDQGGGAKGNQMAPRFITSPAGSADFRYWIIVDHVSRRIIAQSFTETDAKFVEVKLNQPSTPINPRVRSLLAMDLADFRSRLEYENGGPLIQSPEIAILLADLCDHFGFNEGERAIVLGRDLIILLCRLEANPCPVDFIGINGAEASGAEASPAPTFSPTQSEQAEQLIII